MKKLIVIIAGLLFTYSAIASNPTIFTGVVQVPDVASEELYNRALNWFVDVYNDSDKVLQINDKNTGQFVGRGKMSYSPKGSLDHAAMGYIDYTIKVFVRDGRFRYEIIEFIHSSRERHYNFGLITDAEVAPVSFAGVPKKWCQKIWDDIKVSVEERAILIISSLCDSMNKATAIEEDW